MGKFLFEYRIYGMTVVEIDSAGEVENKVNPNFLRLNNFVRDDLEEVEVAKCEGLDIDALDISDEYIKNYETKFFDWLHLLFNWKCYPAAIDFKMEDDSCLSLKYWDFMNNYSIVVESLSSCKSKVTSDGDCVYVLENRKTRERVNYTQLSFRTNIDFKFY